MIAQGTKLEDIAERTDKIRMRVAFRPTVESDLIKGTVIFIDGYGNVITNIDRKLFEKVQKGRDYTIFFRGESYGISKISSTYNEVPPGEKLAIFGSGNFLEIAINKGVEGSGGGANKLFGIKLNDIIRIEFS